MSTLTAPISDDTMPVPLPGSPEAAADREALYKHHAIRGYQYASIAAAPLYIAVAAVRKRPVTLNGALATVWAGGVTGAATGLGVGYGSYKDVDTFKLMEARKRNAYDTRQIRLNDYSTLGAILGALLTPALFWKRTRAVNSVLGGAGLGVAGGSIAHHWKAFQEGQDIKKHILSKAPTIAPTAKAH